MIIRLTTADEVELISGSSDYPPLNDESLFKMLIWCLEVQWRVQLVHENLHLTPVKEFFV